MALQNDVRRLMTSVHEHEVQFVMDHLKTNLQMAVMAAELIRDEALEKILAGEAVEQKVAARLLPSFLFRRWRALKSPFAFRILLVILGQGKYEALLEALRQHQDQAVGLEVSLFKWALGVANDDQLPMKFNNWLVEVIFIGVCKERHEQLGKRLLSDDWDLTKPHIYGHYRLLQGSASLKCPHIVDQYKDKVFELPLSRKIVAQRQFELQSNLSPHAVLISNGVQAKLLDCVMEDDDIKHKHGMIAPQEWDLDTVRFPSSACWRQRHVATGLL